MAVGFIVFSTMKELADAFFSRRDFLLESEQSFSGFLQDPSNQRAYDNALNVIRDSPKGKSRIVFFHSEAGLGKTHLLRSIAHSMREEHRPVIYLSHESFLEFVIEFRNKVSLTELFCYLAEKNEVLLLDDIDFLAHKKQFFSEVLELIDVFFKADKTVVLTAKSKFYEYSESHFELKKILENGQISQMSELSDEGAVNLRDRIINSLELEYDDREKAEILTTGQNSPRKIYSELLSRAAMLSLAQANV